MRCTSVCPSGALEPIADDLEEVARRVRMGTAQIDNEACWARGRRGICRACWYACPLGDRAIVLGGAALVPSIVEERCVGCGRCAEACPPDAHAITVRPRA
jgi:ferredoxin